MRSCHPALQDLFGYALYRNGMQFRSMLGEALAEDQLVPPQLAILTILKSGDSYNQCQLAEELGIDRASMVKFIDGLEACGLVERTLDEQDRRAKLLRLTAKGRRKYESLRKKELAVEEQFMSVLTPSEREALRALLLKLSSQIGSSKS
jgi:DNA-binding MarR family transcriptional regulator